MVIRILSALLCVAISCEASADDVAEISVFPGHKFTSGKPMVVKRVIVAQKDADWSFTAEGEGSTDGNVLLVVVLRLTSDATPLPQTLVVGEKAKIPQGNTFTLEARIDRRAVAADGELYAFVVPYVEMPIDHFLKRGETQAVSNLYHAPFKREK